MSGTPFSNVNKQSMVPEDHLSFVLNTLYVGGYEKRENNGALCVKKILVHDVLIK